MNANNALENPFQLEAAGGKGFSSPVAAAYAAGEAIDPPITHEQLSSEITARRLDGRLRLSTMTNDQLFAFDTMLSLRELAHGIEQVAAGITGLAEGGGGLPGLLLKGRGKRG